ncbi:MAG: 50S ribosomal protein L23 [Deltaproteobacteria bacterium]|nr:50S ribosomal protein L23 [Deltaproteobacteria bacterium]MBW1816449.1 50S ribosomal protein L23 [Deltaproteobacteria bacterium]MBW2284041.1 50S ribosomal protein L23 [Deltaproteobacteria bacterium]
MDIYQIIKEPHVTEKATLQKELSNQITFKVHKKANKVQIKQAVELLLKAKVIEVKTMNVKGKNRRLGRNVGKRPDWKKAMVKLAPGEKVEFFEGI